MCMIDRYPWVGGSHGGWRFSLQQSDCVFRKNDLYK
jgi:hypothetical protein